MRCSIFNCDKLHRNQCCATCSSRIKCKNPCANHPDRCGLSRKETPKETAIAAGVHYIRKATAMQILASGKITGKCEPTGLFIHKNGEWFVGIDNRTGDAWTEEFLTEAGCVEWLVGKMGREEVKL